MWIWDELKRARLITPTGTDLINPDDWVVATQNGLTISESDFAAMFRDEHSDAGKSERLVDAVTGIFQRAELDADLESIPTEQMGGLPLYSLIVRLRLSVSTRSPW
jgi:hypothetical protein